MYIRVTRFENKLFSTLALLASAALLLHVSAPSPALSAEDAKLRGADENPPVVSDGEGHYKAMIRNDRIRFELRYDLPAGPSDVTQAHIHVENPGTNGPNAVFLCTNLGNTPFGATARPCPPSPGIVMGDIIAADVQNAGNLTAGNLEGLARLVTDGATYVNVHSGDNPSGELRGQVNERKR